MAYDVGYTNWYNMGWSTSRQGRYESDSPFLRGMLSWLTSNFGGKSAGLHSQRGSSGNSSTPSAHAFGAALDWSYGRDRGNADKVIAILTSDPARYGVQRIHDYDRLRVWTVGQGWKSQRQGSHGGGMNPGNTWLHIEVNERNFSSQFSATGGGAVGGFFPGGSGNYGGMSSSDPHNWAGIAQSLGNAGDPRFAQYRTGSGSAGQTPGGWSGGRMTFSQVAQVAYNAGFRGQALNIMTAIAMGESSLDPGAHGVDGDDNSYGLWMINMIGSMGPARRRQYGLSSNDDLFDPNVNARVAFEMSKGGTDFTPWTVYTRGIYKEFLSQATAGVEQAASSGMLGQPLGGGGGMTDTSMFGFAAPKPAIQLPSDTKLIRTPYDLIAMYDTGGGGSIHFIIPWWDGSVQWDESKVETISEDEWHARGYGSSVRAGYATELGVIGESFGTFGAFWDSIVGQVLGYTNPAKDDPEVRRVLAEFAARPDMSEAELQNKLRATQWYQNRTLGQLEWNGLSVAEQTSRKTEVTAQMEQAWFQYAGHDLTGPAWSDWVDKIASGETTMGWWIENIAKAQSLGNPESPWSRTLRSEQETQRQRPIDIENTGNNVRDQLNRWGLQWQDNVIQDWATGLVEKRYSDDDLIKEMKNQAKQLFPWKDPEMETITAAQPWIQTYERVLEKPGSLFTSEIQGALQRGTTAWDFEQELKKSASWAGTKNGQAAMYETMGQVGRMFGYG